MDNWAAVIGCAMGTFVAVFVTLRVTRLLDRPYRRRVTSGDQTGGFTYSRSSSMATMTINGVSYTGNNVSMRNGRVIIDGQDVTDGISDLPKQFVEIRITQGVLGQLTTDASVNCSDVAGDVDAGGSVNCDDIKGNVNAGGSVNCDNVGGSVTAGGSVRYG